MEPTRGRLEYRPILDLPRRRLPGGARGGVERLDDHILAHKDALMWRGSQILDGHLVEEAAGR